MRGEIGAPLVYVVTRNHNAYGLVKEFLESLKHLTYRNFKIIVVDDGSTDDSAERIAAGYPEVQIVRTGRYVEYCRSLNMGIRIALQAGAEYVFMVNNDTKDFSPDYLEEMMKPFHEDSSVGMAGSICFDYDGNTRWSGKPKDKLGVPMDVPTEGFMLRGAMLKEVGLLNERLVRYFEDLDLIIRIRKAGYVTRAVESVSFLHLSGGMSSHQRFIPNYYRPRNLMMFIRRYCPEKSIRWKLTTVQRYLKPHIDRAVRAAKGYEMISAVIIGISTVAGLCIGAFMPWSEKNGQS